MATTHHSAEQELAQLRRQVAELEAAREQCEQTERELVAAKARLEHLITASPAVIYVAKPSRGYGAIFISENIQQQLGYHPSDFLDEPSFWMRNIHPEDAARLFDTSGTLTIQQQLFATGTTSHEYRFRHQDGGYRWMHDEMRLIRDGNGEPLEIIGYWTDITADKLYQEALHRLVEGTARATGQDFLRALVRHLAKALDVRYALVGELADTQDCVRTLAVWAGEDFSDNFEYPIAASPLTTLREQSLCCYPHDLKHLFPKDQLLAQIDANSYASTPLIGSSGKPLGIMAVMHDLPIADTKLAQSILTIFAARAAAEMERQKAEQDIRNIKDRLLEAQRLAHIGNWNWIIDEDDLWWSDEVYRIFGATPAEFGCSYISFLDFVHPDDRARVRAAGAKALEENGPYNIEHRIRRPGGEVRYCQGHGKVICDAAGKPARMIGTVQDITGLKQAEMALGRAKKQLEQALLFKDTILERSPVGIAIYDESGQCISTNEAMGHLIGATKAQVLQQNYHAIAPFKTTGMYERIIHAVNNKASESAELSTTSTFGKKVDFNCHLVPFVSAGSDYLLLMVDDLSERKRAEEKITRLLQQNRNLSQRLFEAQEAERKLLARELHDELGQWLTVIQLNTQLISELNEGISADIDDCAHTITESAHKIHQSIRNMIQSLRPALLEELGLSESLQALTAQWQQHHPDIECTITLDEGLDECREDAAITTYRLIQEALNNVAKHSGATRVKVDLRREHIQQSPAAWLKVTIQDNGTGLAPNSVSEGMGLAWMRERVLAAGGDYCLDNQQGSGLRISVCLPFTIDYAI